MAIEAGAKVLVSPHLSVKVVEYAQQKNIPILPGAVTPSEILTGLELGFDDLLSSFRLPSTVA